MIMKEKLLKEFEEWLHSEVIKSTANSYKSEIRKASQYFSPSI